MKLISGPWGPVSNAISMLHDVYEYFGKTSFRGGGARASMWATLAAVLVQGQKLNRIH